MNKATPGPWRVGPIHKDGTFAIHADNSSVVHCKPFSSSFKSTEANARLMAAAPTMLEALENIREWLLFNEHLRDPKQLYNEAFVKANNSANAAIALAKGESE